MVLIYFLIATICTYMVIKVLGINKKQLLATFKSNNANDLIQFLIKVSSVSNSSGTPPEYKFYSELVEDLIKSRNRFGAEIRASLREIRKALILDLREEKKIKDAVFGGYFQYLFMSLFIWGFVYMAIEIIELPGPLAGSYYVVLWQGVGFIVLAFLINIQRKRFFSPFAPYFKAIYQMKALLQAKRPLSEVVACFSSQQVVSNGEFEPFQERIQSLCLHIKQYGNIDITEFDYLLAEIWDHFEIQLLRFSKFLNTVKMLSILIFMLPSFFLCIGLIFSQIAVFE